MPHCIIEFAKDLASELHVDELITTTHQAVFSSGLFDKEDIKTRAIAYEHYQTGSSKKPFVHVTVKILDGRDPKQKSNLAEVILHQIAAMFFNEISITVDVKEIDRETYRKYVI